MAFRNLIEKLLNYGTQRNPNDVSPVTLEIIRAFETGNVLDHDIISYGISKLAVESPFGRVEISWYSARAGGGLSNISLSGKNYPYSTEEIDMILSVAKKRARNLFAEEQQRLEKMLTK